MQKISFLENRRFKTEPEIIIIVLDIITTLKATFRKMSAFDYSLQILNSQTNTTYSLVGTINTPSIDHFNCFIFNPTFDKRSHSDFWLHDSFGDGHLKKLSDFGEISKQRPYILFYKKDC